MLCGSKMDLGTMRKMSALISEVLLCAWCRVCVGCNWVDAG